LPRGHFRGLDSPVAIAWDQAEYGLYTINAVLVATLED
jgi:hypothetical protein